MLRNTTEKDIQNTTIQYLIRLGYPPALICPEYPISFSNDKHTQKRLKIDILCFYNCNNQIRPILLVECKKKIDTKDLVQALVYNQSIKAPIICITDAKDTIAIIQKEGHITSIDYIPDYELALSIIETHTEEDSNP